MCNSESAYSSTTVITIIIIDSQRQDKDQDQDLETWSRDVSSLETPSTSIHPSDENRKHWIGRLISYANLSISKFWTVYENYNIFLKLKMLFMNFIHNFHFFVMPLINISKLSSCTNWHTSDKIKNKYQLITYMSIQYTQQFWHLCTPRLKKGLKLWQM